ncbi:hypothetical protein BC628DRAFT_1416512 [Trametes gibbosa]|nr:hypothetical protein BC628DRAFT_1416512 [Trametes gibbosa]
MSHLPAQPIPSPRRPVCLPGTGPNEQRDFSDLSATLRPPPAPISTAAVPLFRNAVSLPSSPTLCEKFMNSSSRVVRLVDVRSTPTHLLWNLFTHACAQVLSLSTLSPSPVLMASQNKIAAPTPMLAHPNANCSSANTLSGGIWAVFSSHEDARAALGLACDLFTVSPALESDLAMHPALMRLTTDRSERESLPPRHHNGFLPPLGVPDVTQGQDIYSTGGARPSAYARGPSHAPGDANGPLYTISSNPPNPKTSFRAGDWMCSAPNCSAHNFQRNLSCIVCGRQRGGGPPALSINTVHPATISVANPSPRFASRYNGLSGGEPPSPLVSLPSPASVSGFPFVGARGAAAGQVPRQMMASKGPAAAAAQYPPLTPSGRALSVGGRVRNISRDALAPCVMYWPDNEPLPETCQLRPMDSALMTYPPIVNTGNKGAAEKQPGDWLCGKCNYHNWRRRKVCQTCFPYAEGNGDSISPAVQAERIALLTNVLASVAVPPPFHLTTNVPHLPNNVPHDDDKHPSPIYQTHVPRPPHPHRANSIPLPSSSPAPFGTTRGAFLSSSPPGSSRTLLPSFLHDLVHPPSLSPSSASSSSLDLSFDGSSEDAHYPPSSATSAHSHPVTPQQHGPYGASAHNASTSSFTSLAARRTANLPTSIWRLDGDESLTLTPPSASSSGSAHPNTGLTPAPYPRHSPPSRINSGPHLSPRQNDATPKSANDFWQVRYN